MENSIQSEGSELVPSTGKSGGVVSMKGYIGLFCIIYSCLLLFLVLFQIVAKYRFNSSPNLFILFIVIAVVRVIMKKRLSRNLKLREFGLISFGTIAFDWCIQIFSFIYFVDRNAVSGNSIIGFIMVLFAHGVIIPLGFSSLELLRSSQH